MQSTFKVNGEEIKPRLHNEYNQKLGRNERPTTMYTPRVRDCQKAN